MCVANSTEAFLVAIGFAGLGMTAPDPNGKAELPDGVVVPKGTPVPTNVPRTSLLYNEYIVYDVAQVLIRYLVEAEFVYQ
jgi:poly [ADP-ribose] polymerase